MNSLYILSWSFLFATAETALKELKGELDSWQLTPFFLTPKGRNYVRVVRNLLLGCALALLAWGFTHLELYLVCVNLALAILGSFALTATVRFAWLLYLGGFVTVGMTVFLWTR
jgi:hypothetical protein